MCFFMTWLRVVKTNCIQNRNIPKFDNLSNGGTYILIIKKSLAYLYVNLDDTRFDQIIPAMIAINLAAGMRMI